MLFQWKHRKQAGSSNGICPRCRNVQLRTPTSKMAKAASAALQAGMAAAARAKDAASIRTRKASGGDGGAAVGILVGIHDFAASAALERTLMLLQAAVNAQIAGSASARQLPVRVAHVPSTPAHAALNLTGTRRPEPVPGLQLKVVCQHTCTVLVRGS